MSFSDSSAPSISLAQYKRPGAVLERLQITPGVTASEFAKLWRYSKQTHAHKALSGLERRGQAHTAGVKTRPDGYREKIYMPGPGKKPGLIIKPAFKDLVGRWSQGVTVAKFSEAFPDYKAENLKNQFYKARKAGHIYIHEWILVRGIWTALYRAKVRPGQVDAIKPPRDRPAYWQANKETQGPKQRAARQAKELINKVNKRHAGPWSQLFVLNAKKENEETHAAN